MMDDRSPQTLAAMTTSALLDEYWGVSAQILELDFVAETQRRLTFAETVSYGALRMQQDDIEAEIKRRARQGEGLTKAKPDPIDVANAFHAELDRQAGSR